MPAATLQTAPTGKLLQKRIPTFLGLGFLVIALIIGVIFMGQGGGVFAPRATPETTPKNVKVTNVTDTTFTVSFLTDSVTTGFVKYGTEEGKLTLRSSDDRDQLSGTISEYSLHHITVRNLTPGTNYFYVIGTNGGSLFDNNGETFSIQTAKRAGAPSAAKTIYGSVTSESTAPAAGAVVYIKVDGAGDMSALVTNAGGWAVPLSNARTPDGAAYAVIGNETPLNISVQGPKITQTAQGSLTVAEAQPVPTITFGRGLAQAPMTDEEEPEMTPTPTPTPSPTPSPTPTPTPTPVPSASPVASDSASQSLLAGATDASGSATASGSAEVVVVDLQETEKPVVTTSQPTITGKAPSNVKIKIEVHSENQVETEVTSDINGDFEVDLAELGANLEPGEHTVTYTYTDPVTGKDVTTTKTFTVAPKGGAVLAQASTPTPSPTPFGSSNPYPIGGATTSASASPSASPTTASGSAASTRSGQVSTSSGMPVSGAIGTTLALIFGGLFFIIAGSWSFWISSQFAKDEVRR